MRIALALITAAALLGIAMPASAQRREICVACQPQSMDSAPSLTTPFVDAGVVNAGGVDAGWINSVGNITTTGNIIVNGPAASPWNILNIRNGVSNGICFGGLSATTCAAGWIYGGDGIADLQGSQATGVNVSTSYRLAGRPIALATAPTISAGFCSSPAITNHNGSPSFTLTIGTGCAASTGTITLPAATNGWHCQCDNVTDPDSNVIGMASAGTTTTCPMKNYVRTTGVAGNWTDSQVLKCSAWPN